MKRRENISIRAFKEALQELLKRRENIQSRILQSLQPFTLNQEIMMHKKQYFESPGISWKVQKYQLNIIFASAFWLKERPLFPSPKSSK